MTSSHGLRLRPKDIKAVAYPSQWFVEEDHGLLPPAKAAEKLSDGGRLGVPVQRSEGEVIAVFPSVSPQLEAERQQLIDSLTDPACGAMSSGVSGRVGMDDTPAVVVNGVGRDDDVPVLGTCPSPELMEEYDALVKALL